MLPSNIHNYKDAFADLTIKKHLNLYVYTFITQGVSHGIGQDVVITSPESDALCGVRFTIGQSYILVSKYTIWHNINSYTLVHIAL